MRFLLLVQRHSTNIHQGEFNADGSSVWTTYWQNGNKKTESTWKNKHAEGTATNWDEDKNIIYQIQLKQGKPINEL